VEELIYTKNELLFDEYWTIHSPIVSDKHEIGVRICDNEFASLYARNENPAKTLGATPIFWYYILGHVQF
jgi:hypothetical protein